MDRVSIAYYSDLLCVWAYVAEARLDELRRRYAERVAIELRFVPVFGTVAEKIGQRPSSCKQSSWDSVRHDWQRIAVRSSPSLQYGQCPRCLPMTRMRVTAA